MINLFLGIIFLGFYFRLLNERIASKIRNSNYWFFGWLGALLLCGVGASLILKGLNQLHIL